MEENKEQQELNLLTVFQKVFSIFFQVIKVVVKFVGYLLQLGYRYKYIFLVFIALAIAYSVYTTQSDRKVYKADFILDVNDGDSFLYSEMIKSLNQYLKDDDPKALVSVLQIPVEKTSKLSFLKSYFMIDMNKDSIPDVIDYDNKYLPSDTVNVRIQDKIVVSMGMRDIAMYQDVENAIVDYFKRNPYLISLHEARIKSLQEKEKLYDKNIVELDSLQRIEYFQKTNIPELKMDPKLVFKTDKQMFYHDKLNLLKQKEEIVKELTSKQDIVSVVSRFEPTKKPVNSFAKEFTINIIFALVGCLILSLYWENRKRIITYLRKE